MKLTVVVLLLTAASQAIELKSTPRRQQKSDNTDKRELDEGNTGIEKRAPILPTASPSVTPGIEYADSKETQQNKSPAQQIYATPLPQIAKISDVLTGQGPPFQAAIASHLYAPVSVYQTRLGAPTTYEVSRPIASQLAYSEHKISYQPPQNAIQYSQPIQYNQKLQTPKQANFARPINFQQPYQQILFQPQPTLYAHQQQLVSQPIYRQIPQFPIQIQRPVQYIQNAEPSQQYIQQPIYSQEQNLVQVVPAQPGNTYVPEEPRQSQEQATQRESKLEAQQEQSAEKNQISQQEENHNAQPQGAVSYASFSQNQPQPNFAQQRLQQSVQYQPKPQYQVQQLYRVQLQQPQQHQQQLLQIQPLQIQPQIQYQNQQVQLENPQNEHSKSTQESISAASTKSLPVNSGRQISYFRPGVIYPQIQHQLPQVQAYQQSPKVLVQGPQPVPLAGPSFPPVQYFGKFAQSIFGGYHHQ
ncbi:hypothetical protein evm_008719 [Chilo suppressalis]|nr:hypothetical protein evm_008719 [Chilo suppressalis]